MPHLLALLAVMNTSKAKSNVIRRMFREIDAETYIMVDTDDTYPVETVVNIMKMITARRADMVVGFRLSSIYKTQNKHLFHTLGNNLLRNSINHLFHTNIQDIMTEYRAFSYEFVKSFPVLGSGFTN